MKASRFLLVVPILTGLLSTGCASVSLTKAPDDKVLNATSFYVVMQEDGKREVDAAVRDELEKLGRRVSSGPDHAMPSSVDIKVLNEDDWMWDMTMYLLSLNIQFIDPSTGAVLAEGRSYRPSLERKSPAYMAHEVLVKMLNEPDGNGAE